MHTLLYILPNQLFPLSVLRNHPFTNVVVWEHPHFFTKYKYNKKKIVLHRASMRRYYADLVKQYPNARYIEFHEQHAISPNSILFDPITELGDFAKCERLESPNFLLPSSELQSIYDTKKKKDSIRFTTYFYPRAKEYVDILVDIASTDKQNREPFKATSVSVPKLPRATSNDYVKEAQRYVEDHFPKNYGTVDNFHFPIDRTTAKRWLKRFCADRLDNFGTYQDAIAQEHPYMFHSVLSSSLNIGILNPSDIVTELRKHESTTKVNNFEGYVRQLLWREYQRYCYMFLRSDLRTKNRFPHSVKMDARWYLGTLGVEPVDATITKAFDTGYLHHIERLMIMGNFMLLSGIKKEDGFKWFMEFAIDSYEWVMYQNVYDMVFFSTGGKTTHKAYISSSKYVLEMSDYEKGDWTNTWDGLYRQFVKSNFKK